MVKASAGASTNSEPVGIIVTDDMGRITSVAESLAQLGLDGNLLGQRLQNAFPELSFSSDFLATSDVAGPVQVEYSGKELEFDVFRSHGVGGADGKNSLILVKRVNRTSPSAETGELRDKTVALREVVAGIAHEINNPLTFISGWIQMMLADMKEGDPQRDTFKLLKEESDRIGKIVGNLMTFVRRHAPEKRPLSVEDVVQSVLRLVEYQMRFENIRISRRFAPDLPLVCGDGNQLRQVFLNVTINARQAMPNGGELTVTTRQLDASFVDVELRDTGCGIARENLARIFNAFYTTKGEKGTGLGLSVCRSIIQDHGGTLHVESEVGKGTSVCVRLPVHVATASEVPVEPLTSR